MNSLLIGRGQLTSYGQLTQMRSKWINEVQPQLEPREEKAVEEYTTHLEQATDAKEIERIQVIQAKLKTATIESKN